MTGRRRNRTHPFLDHPSPIAFAHRGGATDQPENTMPAFENAVALGYGYIETDVHVTADGVLVAFHDSTLDRVTDKTGRINDLTWTQVAQARVVGIDGTNASIPRFDELLDTFPDVRFNIDPKEETSTEPLMQLLADRDCLERVCVGSFSDRRLRRFAERFGNSICLGLGPRSIARLRFTSLVNRSGSYPGHIAQVPPSSRGIPIVDKRFVEAAHSAELEVHVWTIDDPEQMHRLLDLGVDGVMTDRPRVLREVFMERGIWHG
ncbi:MAG: glycerophosphodiester phosphodiesterase [Actinomycetia bacterium]|nr:glycerophosphodiester phosphodiesterase [Actinomycetes bacterium]